MDLGIPGRKPIICASSNLEWAMVRNSKIEQRDEGTWM